MHANGLSQCRRQQAPVARFVCHSEAQPKPEGEKKDLSDLLSELKKKKKKVWKERGSEQGLKGEDEYAEEGERKDKQFGGNN